MTHPTPNEQDAMKDIERLVAGFESACIQYGKPESGYIQGAVVAGARTELLAAIRKLVPAQSQDAQPVAPSEVIAFLLGEGPLDGVWFGDPHPTERGAFWWRKHLRVLRSMPQEEAATQMQQWQPIETAPRNGLNFLAASAASSVFFAHWANGVVDSSDWDDDTGYRGRYATHWMPLPPPPLHRSEQSTDKEQG